MTEISLESKEKCDTYLTHACRRKSLEWRR